MAHWSLAPFPAWLTFTQVQGSNLCSKEENKKKWDIQWKTVLVAQPAKLFANDSPGPK